MIECYCVTLSALPLAVHLGHDWDTIGTRFSKEPLITTDNNIGVYTMIYNVLGVILRKDKKR